MSRQPHQTRELIRRVDLEVTDEAVRVGVVCYISDDEVDRFLEVL